MRKKTGKKAEEPTTLSGVFGDIMQGLNEAIEGLRGERELRSFTRSTDDEWYTDPDNDKKPDDSAPVVPLSRQPAAKN